MKIPINNKSIGVSGVLEVADSLKEKYGEEFIAFYARTTLGDAFIRLKHPNESMIEKLPCVSHAV